jgi:hypothetical protein
VAKDGAHSALNIKASLANDSNSDQQGGVPDCSDCEKIPFIWSPIIGLCGGIFSAFYLFINWKSDTGHQRLNGYMAAITLAWFVKLLFFVAFTMTCIATPYPASWTFTSKAKHGTDSLVEGFL